MGHDDLALGPYGTSEDLEQDERGGSRTRWDSSGADLEQDGIPQWRI